MAELTFEQKEAVAHNSGNILISASAGSGKTHTMIERVLRLIIEENVDVNQILAVTFTELAAFEMKEKLKKALGNCDKNVKRLYAQIELIPMSDISTLHAFCARLIRSYFFNVNLSPDFDIIDEKTAKAIKNECIEKTFKEFYDNEENWFYTILDRHASARTDKGLKELVLQAYEFCDSEKNPYSLMDNFMNEYSKENFSSILKQYKDDLDSELSIMAKELDYAYSLLSKSSIKKGAEFCLKLLTDIKIVLSSSDIYIIKKPMENFNERFNFERKLTEEQEQLKNIVKNNREKLKKLILKFGKNIAEDSQTDFLRLEKAKEHTLMFVKILKRFAEIYSNEKREENLLDFNDLEHFALKILSDENVRENIKKKYKYIFVDEYQDINSVQESIISLLANENLFMVGDAKQSIYGFRGCRPQFFLDKFSKMQSEGQKVLTLNHNFRSAKAVIDMVNKIFCYSMTEKYFGSDYKGNSELIGGDVYPIDKKGRAVLHLLEKESSKSEQEKPRVYNILNEIKKPEKQKDNHIASLLTEIINDELGKTYYDTKLKKDRQITLNDIAILTRNKHNEYVDGLVRGLNMHGISVISDVKENICDFFEIQMIINALKLIDCFNQDIALASTLLSPIGRFSEEDLAQIVCEFSNSLDKFDNKNWSFLDAFNYYVKNIDSPLAKRLLKFVDYIERLSFSSHFLGAYGLLKKLIDDNDIDSYLYAQSNGKRKVSRLNSLVYATLDGEKKLSLKEFLNKIDSSPEAFTFSDNQEEQAINIMTIHASKGLEFPVVIVCGLERAMNDEDEYGDVLFSRDHGFAFKCFDDQKRIKSETILRGIIKEEMQRERIKEELRLFYVASTRATYSLHLTYEGKFEDRNEYFCGANKFIDYVPNSVNTIRHSVSELSFTELKSQNRKIIIGQTDQNLANQMKEQFLYSYPYQIDTTLPLKLSVTKVVNNSENDGLVHIIFDEPMPDKERGTIAHKIMENFDFESKKDLFLQTEQMIKNNILTVEQVEKVNLNRIQNVISSGVFNCLSGLDLYREKVFLMQIEAKKVTDKPTDEKVLLQGVIDLLAIDNDEAIIIDYKYSSLDKESLKKQYHEQLELYAYATKIVLEKSIKKMIIVNLFTGEIIEI